MNIRALTEKDLGRWVVYRKGSKIGEEALGKLKWWNDHFIFVVYKCDNKWDEFSNYTAQATDPDDLTFL
jgi:hypothetical protein